MKKYVSIDIGGTAIKYGIIDEAGQILFKNQVETEAEKGGPAILKKAVKIVEGFLTLGQDISGICISTAGMVDTKKGEIFYSAPLIPNYIGINFKETMEQKFHLPCEVENDVNCAGLAEYMTGASNGSEVAVMLTIGTGIGGSLVIDGKIFPGFSGSACEVGYMKLEGGDFQDLGATSVLTQKVAALKGEDPEKWCGIRIFEEAKAGDEICNQAINEMVDALGKGIANICYVVNPEVVVLGGGVMAQEEFLKDKIIAAMEKYLVSGIFKHTRLVFAKHRNDAGMLGAFYHFCQRQGK